MTVPMGWIRTVDRELVKESEHILREIVAQIDRMRSPIRISAYAHDSPERLPIGTEDYWLARRRDVLEVLRARGVVQRWSGPISDPEIGDAFIVEVDEPVVRAALKAIKEKDRPYDTSWVATYDPGVLEGCQIVLEDIRGSIDLGRNPIRIRRHGPTQFDHRPPPDAARGMIERRQEILRVLEMKQVIRGWEPVPGQYGSVEAFVVDADRDPVVRTLEAIQNRFTGRGSRPTNPQPPVAEPAAPPVPKPPEQPAVLQEFGREYSKNVAGELGKRTGTAIWWVLAAVVLLILGAIPKTRNAGVEFIRDLVQGVMHPDSSRSK